MFKLKLQRFGDSLGVVLPDELVERLGAHEGDSVFLAGESDGGYRLTARDPNSAEAMARAQKIMDRYDNALQELSE